jgi:hypothetical protein
LAEYKPINKNKMQFYSEGDYKKIIKQINDCKNNTI